MALEISEDGWLICKERYESLLGTSNTGNLKKNLNIMERIWIGPELEVRPFFIGMLEKIYKIVQNIDQILYTFANASIIDNM